jgi:1,4-alpha-glucan branching enzyme
MKKTIFLFTILVLIMSACQPPKADESVYSPKDYVEIQHPEWSKNATIYEVNVRQFTPEGTFKAFESHLPRLKAMGIDIIWLMPIHPIGEKTEKEKWEVIMQ